MELSVINEKVLGKAITDGLGATLSTEVRGLRDWLGTQASDILVKAALSILEGRQVEATIAVKGVTVVLTARLVSIDAGVHIDYPATQ